jgi:hypothetical protein
VGATGKERIIIEKLGDMSEAKVSFFVDVEF